MTKAMSKEYGVDNVLVNTVCIGSIRSGQNYRQAEAAVESGEVSTTEEYYVNRGKGVPLGRVGEVKDIVDAVLYLADAEFVTGVILPVDGGGAAGGN